MNKVLVGFVSVYRGLAVKSHRAEASRLMEEAKMNPGINLGLDSNVQ
jgi:hypothetical protein